MQRPSTQNVILLTAGCFFAFFVFGYSDNLKGPTLPAVLSELEISYGTGGNIFFAEYLGFLIATMLTGVLADRMGLKAAILAAGALLFAGVYGYSSFGSAWALAGALFVIGAGLGGLELGPNAMIVTMHPQRKGFFLNLMSVMHGMGSLFAPLLAGALLSSEVSWRTIYRWDLLLVAGLLVYFLALRFPRLQKVEISPINFREMPRLAFAGILPWFYLAIALYVSAEIGVASWLVTYLQRERGYSILLSNQSLTIFFATLMAGRLLGSFIVQRAGYLRSVLLASFAAIACLALGLYGPPVLAPLLPFTGFFFSIIFPTLTAAVSDLHTGYDNTILGVLFAFAGVGGLVGPFLVAWGSELFGLQAGFSINLALAVLLAVTLGVLLKGIRHEPQSA